MGIASVNHGITITTTLISSRLNGSPPSHPHYTGTNGRGECRKSIFAYLFTYRKKMAPGNSRQNALDPLDHIRIPPGLYTIHTQYPHTCTYTHNTQTDMFTHTRA